MNSTLRDGLSSDAASSVQVGRIESLVFVRHPGHFLLSSVHIWRGNIDRGSQKAVLAELLSKRASNSLKFILGVFFRVASDTGFCAAKWNVGNGALPGHESSESLDLVHVHVGGISHTALSGESMVRVLRSVAGENLTGAIVHSHAEGCFENSVT